MTNFPSKLSEFPSELPAQAAMTLFPDSEILLSNPEIPGIRAQMGPEPLTALPITSAARFSPRGPLGIATLRPNLQAVSITFGGDLDYSDIRRAF
jgi:hypothetical protein